MQTGTQITMRALPPLYSSPNQMKHSRVPLIADNYDGSVDSAHFVRSGNILDEDQGDSEPIRETDRVVLMRAGIEGEEISFI